MRSKFTVSGLVVILLVLLPAGHTLAQTALPHEIKSAYLIAFPRFFTWSDEGSFDQFVIGVSGDDQTLIESLTLGAENRSVRGKPLSIRLIDDLESMRDAQLLFVSSRSQHELAAIAIATRGTNTLIVSDSNADQIHFMINLIQTAENTIVFEINKQNIVYENLVMDRDVLLMGGTELDVAELLIATEQELERGRAELRGFESRVQNMQQELERQNQVIQERMTAADEATQMRDAAERELNSSNAEVQVTQEKLIVSSRSLAARIAELAEREKESQGQTLLIESNRALILDQEASISEQSARLQEQLARLSELDVSVQVYRNWNRIILIAMFAISCLVVFVLYISRQKAKINKLLEAQNIDLRQAKIDLQRESDRADMASKTKGQFLANMSHEIRTPMTAILGYSELLQSHQGDKKRQNEFVDAICRNSGHLLALINDVLDVSKIEAGKAEVHSSCFDLHSLMSDVESMFTLQAKEKKLQLMFDIDSSAPRYVRTDMNKLKQILVNLISNAIKFTDQGTVSIEVEAENADSNDHCALIFRVCDQGSGIEQDQFEVVFGAFEQAKFGLSQHGTGLGLAISRKFMRLMGGDITVTSQIGVGSIFTCKVPVEIGDKSEIEETVNRGAVTAIRGEKNKYRILVVDDNSDNRNLILEVLKVPGIETQEAEDGLKCIEKADSWRPDLIFLDLSMPNMSGEQALSIIKSESKNQDVKVVVLTANVFEEQRNLVLEKGADGFLRKPFVRRDIFSEVAKQLGIRFEYLADEQNASAGNELIANSAKTKINQAVDRREIPSDLLGRLLAAIRSLDRDALESLIGDAQKLDREFASELSSLVDEFKYERVEALVESYGQLE